MDTVPQPNAEDGSRARVIALFEYLVRLVELRSRPVRDVADYTETVWFSDLPDAPEVRFELDVTDPPPEHWLAVRRPRRQPAPPLPAALIGWVDDEALRNVDQDLVIHPVITSQVLRAASDATARIETVERRLQAEPATQAVWDRYGPEWLRWAAEARRLRPVIDLYSRIFSIQQQSQQLGEQYELVLGIGLLTAKTATGGVRRHLVTTRARLTFEEATGQISLGPGDDGVEPVFETDMLDAALTPPLPLVSQLRADLEEMGSALLDRNGLELIFTKWINSVTTDGFVDRGLKAPERVDEEPRITIAPALILRRRTQRSLVSLYRALVNELKLGASLPPLVRGLVEIMEAGDFAPDGRETGPPDEVYFPLATNAEQRRIVQRLRSSRGVVVVGPPGTGKSHTIANLVSDALANGRRVVVTSHTGRALQVLVEKLPPDIRDLCVIMAGEGRGLSIELRRSIDALLVRSSDPEWTAERAQQSADRLRSLRDGTEEERAEVLAARRRIRERETVRHELHIGEYAGTLARIAERLATEREQLGWIPDHVSGPAPLTESEAHEWLGLEQRIRDEVAERAHGQVPADLPTADEFHGLLRDLDETTEEVGHAPELELHPAWRPLARASQDARTAVRLTLRDLRRAVDDRLASTQAWVAEAVTDVLNGLEQPWIARARVTDDVLQRLGSVVALADSVRVDGLDGFDLRAVRHQAADLADHLRAGKGLGFGPFRPAPVKAAWPWLSAVTVDGLTPRATSLVEALIAHADALIAYDDLRTAWGDRLEFPEASAAVLRGHILEVKERLDPIVNLQQARQRVIEAVQAVDELPGPDWSDRQSPSTLEHVAGAADAVSRRDGAAAAVDRIVRRLDEAAASSGAASELGPLRDAAIAHDSVAYRRAEAEVELQRTLAREASRRDGLFERVLTVAPSLAAAVRTDPSSPEWTDWFGSWDRAWNHALATSWAREQAVDGSPTELDQRLARLDVRLRSYTAQLGATLAWRATLGRLTLAHKTHLQAYRQSMTRVGKGTGKYAAHYLAQAKKEMAECIDAIPAWILPTYRLAETVVPRFEPFDLAIVDEASQSGVEALFLWALAKQVVIVGDDQQISPDAVGVDLAVVHQLQNQFLPQVPLRDHFEPATSIFDQAQMRYPGQLQLREHFRCMPEIIEFSNRLCYSTSPLQPVRQFGTDRLEPLRAVHVEGAEEADGVNRREATALAEQVARCCGDPRYSGASMGVISLTGDRQARHADHAPIRSPVSAQSDQLFRRFPITLP